VGTVDKDPVQLKAEQSELFHEANNKGISETTKIVIEYVMI
jgi:hypothetical protein